MPGFDFLALRKNTKHHRVKEKTLMAKIKSNFNYFISLFIAGSMLALWFAAPFFTIFFISIGAGLTSVTWSQFISVSIVFVILALIWKKNGALLPAAVKPGTERRHFIGNVLLMIANALVFLSLLVSIVGFYFKNSFGIAIGFIIAGVLLLAVPTIITGIICVETSRLRNPSKQNSSKT